MQRKTEAESVESVGKVAYRSAIIVIYSIFECVFSVQLIKNTNDIFASVENQTRENIITFLNMGCCKSSPDNGISTLFSINVSSSHTAEATMFREVVNQIPVHCRQTIINLPTNLFLHAYQYHLIANYHLRRGEFRTAIISESQAIRNLEALLPDHKDHFIFVDMYNTLSLCLSLVGAVSAAIEGNHMALAILLKHTPTDYAAISTQHFQLSSCYLKVGACGQAIEYLRKAIEIARLSNEPNREDIQMLETLLHLLT
jgi:tetratricopeptide (TPR) repeat protein